MLVKNINDLEVYKESLRLLKILYDLLKDIPASEFNTVYQCKKCGTSIPSNIAEGWAKRMYAAELKRFLTIAIGSSDELVNHLKIVAITVPHLEKRAIQLSGEYQILSKRLNSMYTNWHVKKE